MTPELSLRFRPLVVPLVLGARSKSFDFYPLVAGTGLNGVARRVYATRPATWMVRFAAERARAACPVASMHAKNQARVERALRARGARL